MQGRSDQSFFAAETIEAASPVRAGLTLFLASICLNFCFLTSLTLNLARYGVECIERWSEGSDSMRCLAALIRPKWPSYMVPNSANICINLCQYFLSSTAILTSTSWSGLDAFSSAFLTRPLQRSWDFRDPGFLYTGTVFKSLDESVVFHIAPLIG